MHTTDARPTLRFPRLQHNAVLGWNLAFSASACAASYSLVSPRFALALGVGALLEVVSFRSLWRSCEKILLAGAGGAQAAASAGIFGLRFLLLVLTLFVAIRLGVHPLGLVIGVMLIVPAVVIAAWRARPPIDPNAPVLAADDPAWDAWNPWLAREDEPPSDDDDDEPRSILAIGNPGSNPDEARW